MEPEQLFRGSAVQGMWVCTGLPQQLDERVAAGGDSLPIDELRQVSPGLRQATWQWGLGRAVHFAAGGICSAACSRGRPAWEH